MNTTPTRKISNSAIRDLAYPEHLDICAHADCGEERSIHSEGCDICARHELEVVLASSEDDWVGGASTREGSLRSLRLELLPSAVSYPLWTEIRWGAGATPAMDAEIERLYAEVA